MFVGAPFVETKQDSRVRVEELTKVIMGRWRVRLAEENWYHWRLARTSFTPMIVQVRFMAQREAPPRAVA